MSIPVNDKYVKSQVSNVEVNNTPFLNAVKELWDTSQDFGQHICTGVSFL